MKKIKQDIINNIINEYSTNKNIMNISNKFSVSKTQIHRILKTNNVKIRTNSEAQRKYPFNEHYFDIIDTEEKSYFLGLLYADGFNNQPESKIKLALQTKDLHIIEKLQSELQSNRPLKCNKLSLKNPNWQDSHSLNLNSKHMSQQLAKLGCFYKKSLILKFPTQEQVSLSVLRHFIRGYFDGDGCIYIREKRNEIVISLISTLNFCESLKDILSDYIGINSNIRKKGDNGITNTLFITGNIQCLKFLDWIYSDSTTYLYRKYQKYIEFSSSRNKSLQ